MNSSKYIIEFTPKFILENQTNNNIESIIEESINKTFKELSQNNLINLDIINNPLTNKCDLVRDKVLYILDKLDYKKRFELLPLETQNILDSNATGHSILIASFLNDRGEKDMYLIDPTYSQFFLKENCTKDKYLINHDKKMVLLAPDPGFYYTINSDKTWLALKLLEKGFIKLNEETAKIYFDSFNKTKRGYSGYLNLTGNPIEISGKVYLNSILKEFENSKVL